MLKILCLSVALGFALVSPGAAADKSFSWDDDSITSSGAGRETTHDWGDGAFNIHADEQSYPDSLPGSSKNNPGPTWEDAPDTPSAHAGRTESERPRGWEDVFEKNSDSQQHGSTQNKRKNDFSWGDGIDTPATSSNESAGSNAKKDWGDSFDTSSGNQGPDNTKNSSGGRDLSWGDGIDTPPSNAGNASNGDINDGRGDIGQQRHQTAAPAKQSGIDRPIGLAMLVIDRDASGTNVRNKPSGAKTYVIPLQYPEEVRSVIISGTVRKGWFELMPGGLADEGWMHRSVLGICAGASAKGGANAYLEPSTDGPSVQIPAGIPLTPLDMKNGWMKVRLGMGNDSSHSECWIQQDDLVMNEEELSDCAMTWSDR
ncbi:MAG: hypothetical protein J6I40_01585 [Mailhella sp.]|nr:hypothetical protein [Mailhella sp.]